MTRTGCDSVRGMTQVVFLTFWRLERRIFGRCGGLERVFLPALWLGLRVLLSVGAPGQAVLVEEVVAQELRQRLRCIKRTRAFKVRLYGMQALLPSLLLLVFRAETPAAPAVLRAAGAPRVPRACGAEGAVHGVPARKQSRAAW